MIKPVRPSLIGWAFRYKPTDPDEPEEDPKPQVQKPTALNSDTLRPRPSRKTLHPKS